AFEREQPVFDAESRGIAADRAVAGNHAVARDQDRQRVTAVGLAYSARRVRLADVSRHVAVRAHAAERNRKQRLPYAPLKRRAVRRQRQIEFAALAGKVLAELRACGGASARVARAGSLLAVEA